MRHKNPLWVARGLHEPYIGIQFLQCCQCTLWLIMIQFHVLSHPLSSHNHYKSDHPRNTNFVCHSKYCPLHVLKAIFPSDHIQWRRCKRRPTLVLAAGLPNSNFLFFRIGFRFPPVALLLCHESREMPIENQCKEESVTLVRTERRKGTSLRAIHRHIRSHNHYNWRLR